jgi:hypothetical protein
MNVISSRAAYALYPDATFVRYFSLCIANGSRTEANARVKYSRRGWSYVMDISHQEALMKSLRLGQNFVAGERWLGDKQTWMIPFEGFPSSSSEDMIRLNGWRMVYKGVSYGFNETKTLGSKRLKRFITVSPTYEKLLKSLLNSIPSDIQW